ncbi:unnamed protein product [Aphanomyces euteiches]|nr:hypothetical protein Ae201684_005173 [Aphanomyces euteiches]KAH9053549.1 hypothetical protein Ae201684P_015314 [Aphanomyces euteiches]KAH9088088.1 hypothetical protein Ae201684P_021660 [Aphanomyces euteiches]
MYNIVSNGYGLALSNTANDVIAFVTKASGDTLQDWYYNPALKQVKNRGTGLCLDAYQPADGGAVHTYACDSTIANQQWKYDSSTKQLKHSVHTGFCLDMGSSTGEAPNLWSCLASSNPDINNQLFSLKAAVDNTIVMSSFSLVLTNVDSSAIQFQTAKNSLNQQWRFDSTTQLIRSVGTNKCLDAWEGKNDGGVHLYDCSTNSNQKWKYNANTKQLQHASWTGYCLDIGSATGETPHLWSCLATTHVDYKNQQVILN